MHNDSKHALITGASSGIGLELAKVFARNGFALTLVARDRVALETVGNGLRRAYGIDPIIISKDLSRPGAADEIFHELTEASIHVDVLVNNAGVGTYGPFAHSDLDAELAMMRTNMAALIRLTKLFLEGMLARGDGKILNVASTAAFQPGPLMAVYCATKAFVLSFTEALANELHGSGVSASVLCPGPTQSQFKRRSGMDGSRIFDLRVMDAAAVATIGYHGLTKGKIIILPGFTNKSLTFLVRLAPRRIVLRLVRLLFEKPTGKRGIGFGECDCSPALISNTDFRVSRASKGARTRKGMEDELS